jgi:hypothetical protein
VPESKVRKEAAEKKVAKRAHKAAVKQYENLSLAERMSGTRDWVPWVFVPLGLLGVAWLLVFYIAGSKIPFMVSLGNWNFLIGIGLIASAFVVSTAWK